LRITGDATSFLLLAENGRKSLDFWIHSAALSRHCRDDAAWPGGARKREKGGPGPRLTVTVTPERTESLPIRTRAARQGTQGYRPRGMLRDRPGEVGHPHHVPVPEVGGPKGPVSGPGIGTSPSPMHVPGDRNSPGPFSCRMEEICPSLFTSAAGTPTSRAPGPARGSSSPSRRA